MAPQPSALVSPVAESVERWLDEQDRPGRARRPRTDAARKERPHWRRGTRREDDDQVRSLDREPRAGGPFNLQSFFRACSMNLCSAIFGINIVLRILVENTSPRGGSRLDIDLNWVISVPVAGTAFLWELSQFITSWHWPLSTPRLVLGIVAEATLGVGSAICAVLAAFQVAGHRSYNARHGAAGDGPVYLDVGPEIALAVLLGCLTISSFGSKIMGLIEANRRRVASCSRSSSVIEIIA